MGPALGLPLPRMGGALLQEGDGPLRLVVENEIACWIKGLCEISDQGGTP